MLLPYLYSGNGTDTEAISTVSSDLLIALVDTTEIIYDPNTGQISIHPPYVIVCLFGGVYLIFIIYSSLTVYP